MKILITGSEGFVGQETIKNYIKRYEIEMCEFRDNGYDILRYDLMKGFDIRDIEQLLSVCQEFKPDRILHLAAIARFADADKDPKLAFETNVLGTKNVAKVCKELHIPLVYASTGSIYMPITEAPPITEEFEGKGNSVYGCTKYMGELYVKECTHIILRYAHLYGREKRMHGLIGGFLDRINRGLAPTLYGGKQSNDFTYVKDVARANILALEAPWDKWNQAYNIGTGEELSAEKAGEIVCEFAHYEGEVEIKEQRTVDPQRFVFDVSKAKVMLGFEAEYDFKRGLEDMWSTG
ncbi:NAD-dependent epimerase/dehydratase family protein [candidate division WWE3 bacterium]|jgi:nucleoside-diphosphate-sugar epimerase|nr:NAD-dependent epimerase/dehydratase family protein [Candidatus Scalindua sp.]MBT7349925.1 NAD-dependent epimerase/dehydratase family protein [candidate division WWE3 bacterium]